MNSKRRDRALTGAGARAGAGGEWFLRIAPAWTATIAEVALAAGLLIGRRLGWFAAASGCCCRSSA